MESECEELLNVIEREFIQLRYRWNLFCQLFDSGKNNIDLLNKSGSNVFQLFQNLIIDDMMMALCRLSDPDKFMGHENASIKNLSKKIKGNLSESTNKKIDEKILELEGHMRSISILRNKALSHTDFNHALNVELLPRPTYDELEKSMEAMRSILNMISGNNATYIPIMPVGRDGNKLLQVLAKAHNPKSS